MADDDDHCIKKWKGFSVELLMAPYLIGMIIAI